MDWLCIVACYDSIVVTSEDTGTVPTTIAHQQSAGQPTKEKHRIGHTTPGMYMLIHFRSYEDKYFGNFKNFASY